MRSNRPSHLFAGACVPGDVLNAVVALHRQMVNSGLALADPSSSPRIQSRPRMRCASHLIINQPQRLRATLRGGENVGGYGNHSPPRADRFRGVDCLYNTE